MCGDQISQRYAGHAAYSGDGHGLGQKLNEDMTAARAQRLFDADLPSALLHGYQHDVHQADAGDAQRQRAHQSKQNRQRNGQQAER